MPIPDARSLTQSADTIGGFMAWSLAPDPCPPQRGARAAVRHGCSSQKGPYEGPDVAGAGVASLLACLSHSRNVAADGTGFA